MISTKLSAPFARLRRVTPMPLLARVVVFGAGWAGLLLALPSHLMAKETLIGTAVLALLAAALPATGAVTAMLLVIVGAWLMDTVGFGAPVTFGRLFAITCAMYVAHSAAALAAVLPYDAIVDRGVLGRWAARGALVLLSCAVLGLLVTELLPAASGASAGPVGMLLAGLVAMLSLVWLLSRLARR